MMTLSQTLPKAWTAFTNSKRYLLIAVLFEFLFLFTLAQIHLAIFLPSAEAATRLSEAMTDQVQTLQDSDMYQLETLLYNNPDFMAAYHDLIRYIGLFIISVFAAWLVFRSPVWVLSYKSAPKNMPLGKALLKFCLLSLFWFFALGVAFVIYSMATGSGSTLIPIVSSTASSVLMLMITLIIAYFAQVSFALVPAQQTFKKTFIYGTRYARHIVPVFIVNLLIVFVALTLPFNWIQTVPLLSLAIILFITIPALAFARLNLITAIWLKHS